jgi:hypothetical protein
MQLALSHEALHGLVAQRALQVHQVAAVKLGRWRGLIRWFSGAFPLDVFIGVLVRHNTFLQMVSPHINFNRNIGSGWFDYRFNASERL